MLALTLEEYGLLRSVWELDHWSMLVHFAQFSRTCPFFMAVRYFRLDEQSFRHWAQQAFTEERQALLRELIELPVPWMRKGL
jgi:hypothetical protein